MVDRATTYHDGKEPYIKLGRLAVMKEFRGAGISGRLVNGAVLWLKNNPTYFDRFISQAGVSGVFEPRLSEEDSVWKG